MGEGNERPEDKNVDMFKAGVLQEQEGSALRACECILDLKEVLLARQNHWQCELYKPNFLQFGRAERAATAV